MKPVAFDGQNTVYAADQPQYLPLPAYKNEQGQVLTCWKLSVLERLQVLVTGRVWLSMLTFNQPLQPVRLRSRWNSLWPFLKGEAK